MTTKIVCRLFDRDGVTMLGWELHEAAIPGDGTIRASSSISVPIDRAGVLTFVSWHWADVNVETRVLAPASLPVKVGDIITVAKPHDVLIVCGPMPGPLPAVTMRGPVAVGVPVGQLGARP